jgi:CheY-like chemotaxis protein
VPLVPTVLVVDDVEPVRVVVRRILEAEGYQVEEAADGHEALALLGQRQVDAVVTDLRMPGLNGWQLAARLANRRIPLLFISGYDYQVDTGELPGPVLAKPFMPEQLITTLQRLLSAPQPKSA